jgi:hypothetical protein
MSAPWRLLVAPVRTWREIGAQSLWWTPVVAQWVLVAAGFGLSARTMSELAFTAGLRSTSVAVPWYGVLGGVALLLPVTVILNLIHTLVAWLWLKLVGSGIELTRLFVWLACGMLPFVLGNALGQVVFAAVQPLAQNPAAALSLQLRPFAAGLTTFLPGHFDPLSFPWFIAAYFDIFGIWSILLVALGARHYLGYGRRRTAWVVFALVLLWGLSVTCLWQGTQLLMIGQAG